MSKLEFKKTVLAQAKERQQEIINDFKRRIQELNSTDNAVEEDQQDHAQQSLDATNDHLINGLADQLNFVVEEMNVLNKMHVAEELHQTVAMGSIVKTDKHTFFPSVSIEKFEANGQELFGVSSKSPIYQAMQGKKAGDSFEYNKTKYTISEVY
ncbi:MAG: GreA/GreB family elongation factor [Flavobacteriales bacterium]|nr:GreA/GreB family elongation factor [Flavobacteriales bacterium]